MTLPVPLRSQQLAEQLGRSNLTVIDVREPVEFVGGHIAGSLNVPLSRIAGAELPAGDLVLVCQSGARSTRALAQLGHRDPATSAVSLEGGISAWQQQGLPLRRLAKAPLPLMRQVQIAAGSLVLLGVILSQAVAPAWILLSGFVGAGLVFAGITGFCGMARLLTVLPWNRVSP